MVQIINDLNSSKNSNILCAYVYKYNDLLHSLKLLTLNLFCQLENALSICF